MFRKRKYGSIVLLAILTILFWLSHSTIRIEAPVLVCVYGRVMDAATGQPIAGASILLWKNGTGTVAKVRTNMSGIYEVSVNPGAYHVYAYFNRSSNPGFDYLPARRELYVEGESLNCSFDLLPGASIEIAGNFHHFDFLPDVKRIIFSVADSSGLLNKTGSVRVYGEGLLINQLLNLSDRTVLAPSGIPFKVGVEVLYVDGMTRHFTIDDEGDYLNLTQGAKLVIDVNSIIIKAEYESALAYISKQLGRINAKLNAFSEYGLTEAEEYYRPDLERCDRLIEKTGEALAEGSYLEVYRYIVEVHRTLDKIDGRLSEGYHMLEWFKEIESLFSLCRDGLDEAERLGFYIVYERSQLSRAGNLMDSARLSIIEGDRFLAFGDLHEAMLILKNLETDLSIMNWNARQSVFFITPYLGFTAVILASILVDKQPLRVALSLIIYSILLWTLYLLHPGYTLMMKAGYGAYPFLPLVVASFLLPLLLIYGLPTLFGKRPSKYGLCFVAAVAAAFSISARNLRRRRLRALLTASLLVISVFSLITLTHVSLEYGLFAEKQPGRPPSESLLIRRHREGAPAPFVPLPQRLYEWLEERPEVTRVVPLIKNDLQKINVEIGYKPLTRLYNPDNNSTFDVKGLLGVYPSIEINITRISEIIVEGRFLQDRDLNGILISREAAEMLRVGLNDTLELYGRRFTITGIFDSERLDETRDLNGEPIVPPLLLIYKVPDGPPLTVTEYVHSEHVVIIHGETALELPKTVISRIAVQTRTPEEMEALARLTVLNWPDIEAFYPMFGRLYRMRIGEYRVEIGFETVMVPLIIATLNIGVTMLGDVYERRREALAMSCVGLNPLHISAVFVAKALVIGVVAGTLGYIFGISSYRLIALLPFPFGVRQKVEPIWGVLALCFSISAAILGSLPPAAKASMIATPSLMRRWRIEKRPGVSGEPWVINIPLEVHEREVIDLFRYLSERLRKHAWVGEWFEDIVLREIGPSGPVLFFVHRWENNEVHTLNRLVPVKSRPHHYTFQLVSRTKLGTITGRDERQIRITANIIRRLTIQYRAEKRPDL